MDETNATTTLPVATSAQVRAVVVGLLRRRPGRVAAVAALFLVASALGLVMPACLGRIVDAVSNGADSATVGGWVAGVAAGAIGAAAVSLWGARVLTALVQDALASLREEVLSSAMQLPVATVEDGETADLLSRVTGDVDAVSEAGGDVVPTLLSAGFAVAVSLVALTALDPWLAVAGLASMPFYVLGSRAFLRRSRIVFREVRAREAARSQAVIEAVDGVETLTALGEQGVALDRVRVRAERSIDSQIDGVRLQNRLFRWINGGEAVGLVAILVAGFLLHASDAITVGTVTTAALVFHRLFDPIGRLILGLDDIQRASIGLARLVGVIELAPSTQRSDTHTDTSLDRGARGRTAIEVRDVHFRYPGSGRGLHGVDLRVEPGSTVALVGPSGSGKSTLARLLAGHHSPTDGTIVLDPPVAPYYLSQELHHFRGSIGDNMRLAAPGVDDERIREALESVGAAWAVAAVTAHPGSSDAAIPPLDEGRIQQLAIARAILADPAVVILDEVTADVGLQHRAAVDEAITALRAGRTTVLIAHRLDQASAADRIVVVEDGRVAQQGTHEELVAMAGSYRDSWLAQTGHGRSDTTKNDTANNDTKKNDTAKKEDP